MSSAPLGEPSDIADQLAKAIDGASRDADVAPQEIVVRFPEVPGAGVAAFRRVPIVV